MSVAASVPARNISATQLNQIPSTHQQAVSTVKYCLSLTTTLWLPQDAVLDDIKFQCKHNKKIFFETPNEAVPSTPGVHK